MQQKISTRKVTNRAQAVRRRESPVVIFKNCTLVAINVALQVSIAPAVGPDDKSPFTFGHVVARLILESVMATSGGTRCLTSR